MNTVLLGEVGLEQTNIKIVKVKVLSSQTTIVNEASLENKDYNSLLHMLTEFLQGNFNHSKAIVIVPGFVINNRMERKSGFPWKVIDGLELAKALQIPFFTLLNKIETISLYSKFLRTSDVVEINPKYVSYPDKRLLIYVGEEVQTSVIIASSPTGQTSITDQKVLLSAGANNSFCPKSSKDFEFQQFLKKDLGLKVNQTPSFQNMLSSAGILNIYRYFGSINAEPVPKNLNYKILMNEIKKGSNTAVMTLNYYFEILGNFMQQMSVAYLPEGGIYLFGGDFCRLVSFAKEKQPQSLSILLDNFLLEGHLKPRFSEFRVCVCVGEAEMDVDKVLKHL